MIIPIVWGASIFSWGPCSLKWYGFWVALALSVYLQLLYHSAEVKRYIPLALFDRLVLWSIVFGVLGARIVHLITNGACYQSYQEMIAFWDGGLSMWGAVIAVCITLIVLLRPLGYACIAVFDRAAFYAPIMHGIARLGCLFAGCCHGAVSTGIVTICYTHEESLALILNQTLFPAQLLSVLLYAAIFMIFYGLYALWRAPRMGSGWWVIFYLLGASLERFLLDFYRIDRTMAVEWLGNYQLSWLSQQQWLSLFIFFIVSAVVFLGRFIKKRRI